MKKILTIMLFGIIVFGLTGCGNNQQQENNQGDNGTDQKTTESNPKKLSCSGPSMIYSMCQNTNEELECHPTGKTTFNFEFDDDSNVKSIVWEELVINKDSLGNGDPCSELEEGMSDCKFQKDGDKYKLSVKISNSLFIEMMDEVATDSKMNREGIKSIFEEINKEYRKDNVTNMDFTCE